MAMKRGVSVNLNKRTKLPTTGQPAPYWKQWLRNHQMLSAKTGRATLNASKIDCHMFESSLRLQARNFTWKWTLMRVCFKSKSGVFLQYRTFIGFRCSFCALSSCFCGCDNNMASIYIYFSLVWPACPIFTQGCQCWLYKCPAHKMGFSHARLKHSYTYWPYYYHSHRNINLHGKGPSKTNYKSIIVRNILKTRMHNWLFHHAAVHVWVKISWVKILCL